MRCRERRGEKGRRWGSGRLVQQRGIQPGEKLALEDWGDLGKSESASLVCRYFTGLRTTTSVFWYSPSNVLGRDSCTFVSRERYRLRR